MAVDKTVSVTAWQLRDAFDFVSAGNALDHSASIGLDTGMIYRKSADAALVDDELPADIDASDRYLAVPGQRDLIGVADGAGLDSKPS